VVLETLPPAERVAFVLHDIFGLSFDAIAPILERAPEPRRQLASRGRRRVQARTSSPDADPCSSEVCGCLLAASQEANRAPRCDPAPDVVLRGDNGDGRRIEVHGQRRSRGARVASRSSGSLGIGALINGVLAWCAYSMEKLLDDGVTSAAGRSSIDVLRDPEQLRDVD